MIIGGQPPDITRDILRDYVDRKRLPIERKLSRRVTLRSLSGRHVLVRYKRLSERARDGRAKGDKPWALSALVMLGRRRGGAGILNRIPTAGLPDACS